ncbi:hypothetical protein BJ170DRAFT_678637 [Xylariales sp. AK1849]|nr:hypothetical protein BJ170DRAFT_678637 [Xylariales sp. AK1849]
MATNQPVKQRAVAGTFLFRFPTVDTRKVEVALFRRSGKVRTYQHKLAPISGSVEEDDASPEATAWREIKEETTLDSSSIELLRKGMPYSFVDESIGREWIINPFAFRLKSVEEGGQGESGITIDWEHSGWEWYQPLEVNDSEEFGGVPKLLNSLRRVWPEYDLGAEAGSALTQGLQDLRTDHESGARQLATKAVTILGDVISKTGCAAIDDVWWANIRMAAWHLCKNGRESMGAAIISALVNVLDDMERILKDKHSSDTKLPRLLAVIDEHLSQRDSAVQRIHGSFISFVKSNVLGRSSPRKSLSVLTLSFSSTISSCLLKAAASLDVTLDLRILESRPLCEGVTLASRLLREAEGSKRVHVTLYSDASASLAAEGVDMILLGADRISSVGDVSNKTGSLPAVLSTRHVTPEAKVVVLSEVEKIAGPGAIEEHVIEDNDPAELIAGWQCTVKGADLVGKHFQEIGFENDKTLLKVKNVYFEWVPAKLVDAYITDAGSWSIDDIKSQSKRIGMEVDRFFSDL